MTELPQDIDKQTLWSDRIAAWKTSKFPRGRSQLRLTLFNNILYYLVFFENTYESNDTER